jgi:hypothetical protein
MPDDEKAIAIQSLSDAQLIAILQQDDGDENDPYSIRRIVDAEIDRRRENPWLRSAADRKGASRTGSGCWDGPWGRMR